MGLLNPEKYVPGRQKLEEAEGVRERLGSDMKEVMSYISRGDVCFLFCRFSGLLALFCF